MQGLLFSFGDSDSEATAAPAAASAENASTAAPQNTAAARPAQVGKQAARPRGSRAKPKKQAVIAPMSFDASEAATEAAEGAQTRGDARGGFSVPGAAVSVFTVPEAQVAPTSSYAYDKTQADVQGGQPLRTFRVQTDHGSNDRMRRGFQTSFMPLLPNVDAAQTERPAIFAMLPLLTQGQTAPGIPPPTINDPDFSFNWKHLVDSWPLRSRRPCSNCLHAFDAVPWMIPIKRIENYYKMDDSDHVFCSYGCTKRFLIGSHYPDRFIYMVYLDDIARNYFQCRGDLVAAPPRLWLESMSVDEYRALLCPPPFCEFPARPGTYNAKREALWMADMTMLRPPFLSGTAIMEWVSRVMPETAREVKAAVERGEPVSASMMMGPLVDEGAERGMRLETLRARDAAHFRPWSVEGIHQPSAEEVERVEASRIVLPPPYPGAPAMLDEVARMRREVGAGGEARWSEAASGAQYAQEVVQAGRSKRRAQSDGEVLEAMLKSAVTSKTKKDAHESLKRARDDDDDDDDEKE